jgi:hypothetical protein
MGGDRQHATDERRKCRDGFPKNSFEVSERLIRGATGAKIGTVEIPQFRRQQVVSA